MNLYAFENAIKRMDSLERKVKTRTIRELEIKRRCGKQYKASKEFVELATRYYDFLTKRLRLKRRENQIKSYMSFS